jgi:hypothetical protein
MSMHIFMFKSQAANGLRAFAGDSVGTKLPPQHGPWQSIGVYRPMKDLPHNMSRKAVERAIEKTGYQLWRLKAKTEDA